MDIIEYNKLTDEQKIKYIQDEINYDVANCSDPYGSDAVEYYNDINGFCTECGRPTIDGECFYGCSYSPVDCKICKAHPCDGSC